MLGGEKTRHVYGYEEVKKSVRQVGNDDEGCGSTLHPW